MRHVPIIGLAIGKKVAIGRLAIWKEDVKINEIFELLDWIYERVRVWTNQIHCNILNNFRDTVIDDIVNNHLDYSWLNHLLNELFCFLCVINILFNEVLNSLLNRVEVITGSLGNIFNFIFELFGDFLNVNLLFFVAHVIARRHARHGLAAAVIVCFCADLSVKKRWPFVIACSLLQVKGLRGRCEAGRCKLNLVHLFLFLFLIDYFNASLL